MRKLRSGVLMPHTAAPPWWQRWRVVITARKWWAILAAVAAIIGAAVLASLLGRSRRDGVQLPGDAKMDEAVARYRERTAVANARAAVEITAARTKDAQVQAELKEILAKPDPKEQADALIALDARVRAGR